MDSYDKEGLNNFTVGLASGSRAWMLSAAENAVDSVPDKFKDTVRTTFYVNLIAYARAELRKALSQACHKRGTQFERVEFTVQGLIDDLCDKLVGGGK